MTAFARQPSPSVVHHAKGEPLLIGFTVERETAAVMRSMDPHMHGVDPCRETGAEHYVIRSGGDLVCANCERVFWRMQF